MFSTQLTTADGHLLQADLAEPEGTVRGSVVVCHPHPLHGGNRHNTVVEAVFRALPATGFRALRFDFRAEHGDGVAETADVVAAIDAVAAGAAGRPTFVIGYSFGACVALRTVDPRVAAVVAIAPPLPTMPVEPPAVPVLVLSPRTTVLPARRGGTDRRHVAGRRARHHRVGRPLPRRAHRGGGPPRGVLAVRSRALTAPAGRSICPFGCPRARAPGRGSVVRSGDGR